MKDNSIMNIGERCFGCTSCKHICPEQCISMQEDTKGFLYPAVDAEICTNCGVCLQRCPASKDIQEQAYPLGLIYGVKHKEEGVRMQSASGGAFTALSDYILNNNGVVYGAGYGQSMKVEHQRAETKEMRNKLRGSKYVASELKDAFLEIREDAALGTSVYVTGTPCQIAGLRLFLGNQYPRVVTSDLICTGVPPYSIFHRYLELIEEKYQQKVAHLLFRDKKIGWRGTNITVQFDSGMELSHRECELVRSYAQLFESQIMLRPCCYTCPFTQYNRQGDITISDFWGIEHVLPEFEDNKGVSLVLVNSPKGRELYSQVEESLDAFQTDPQSCYQDRLGYPSPQHPRAAAFWRDFAAFGYAYISKKYAGMGE